MDFRSLPINYETIIAFIFILPVWTEAIESSIEGLYLGLCENYPGPCFLVVFTKI